MLWREGRAAPYPVLATATKWPHLTHLTDITCSSEYKQFSENLDEFHTLHTGWGGCTILHTWDRDHTCPWIALCEADTLYTLGINVSCFAVGWGGVGRGQSLVHLTFSIQFFTLLDNNCHHTLCTICRDYSRWILRQKTRAGAATRVSQGLPRHYGGLPVGVKWCHTNLDGSFNKYVKEIRGSSARKLWCT